jgi:hypothetical protein
MRYMHKLFPLVCACLLALAACSPTPTIPPSDKPTEAVSVTQAPAIPAATATLTVGIEASPTQFSEPVIVQPLFLQILSPQDEETVSNPQIDVIGLAPVGAVISVNEDILIVGVDGQFKSIVALEEGLNLIEIVASDASGDETYLELTVAYEP